MFRRQRQFNIITGEVSSIPLARRSLSCSDQFQNLQKTQNLRQKMPKLGDPKDKKQFKYSYFDLKPQLELSSLKSTNQKSKLNEIQNKSMLNYVSTDYNIINHTKQIQTSKIVDSLSAFQKMPKLFKKSPLTEHFHSGRKYAPNYHQNYQFRTDNNQFNRKIGLCSSICGIQKTYGRSKYFRKYK